MSMIRYKRELYEGSLETIEDILDSLNRANVLAVDTETINLKNQNCVGIGVQWSDIDRLYIQVLPETSSLLPFILELLSQTDNTKIYFNVGFDYRVLAALAKAESFPAPDLTNIEDVSVAAQVQGNSDHSLDALSIQYLAYSNQYSIKGLLQEARSDQCKSPTTLDVPFEQLATKCLNDVWATWHLWKKLWHLWPNDQNRECYEVDIKLLPILFRMEKKGLLLDQAKVTEHYNTLHEEVEQYASQCNDLGFNPGSPGQVGFYLASRGNILPFTKSGRQLRTDEEALGELDDPVAQLILRYRKANKLLSTYVTPWKDSERAYTHFRIDLSTGRLASFDRNLQNIPPAMRDVFSSDGGMFSWADYSQIEMRIFAHLSQDPEMMTAYREGRDIHAMTQLALWPGSDPKDSERRLVAKTYNFAMLYDANTYTLARNTGLSESDCSEFRSRWFQYYKGGRNYIESRKRDQSPYAVSDFGRRMSLPDTSYSPQSHINKCKINYVIQGTAADIIKRAMVRLGDIDLRLQIHDELVVDGAFEFPEFMAHIHPEIYTPIEQKQGSKWSK